MVIEGNSLPEVPLDEIFDTHRLSKSSMTVLLKELDVQKKTNEAGLEFPDLFGVSDWSTVSNKSDMPMSDHDPRSSVSNCRIVFK